MGGWMIYDRAGRDPNTQQGYPSSSASGLAPSPFFAISSPLTTEALRFGYATYFPTGAVADFDEQGSQRYELISGYMVPWYHQFTVAYRPSDDLSIGVSGIYSASFFKSELDVDLAHFANQGLNINSTPSENPSLAWRAKIPLSTAHAIGAGLGILWWPTFQWSMGVSVYSPMSYTFSGPLNFNTQGSMTQKLTALRALGVDDSIRNEIEAKTGTPWIIQGGFRYQPFGYWTMEYFGRYAFSSFNKSLSLRFRNSSVQGLKNLYIPGKSQEDTYLISTVQTFSLWQRWVLGLTTSFYKNGIRDELLSLTRADFDSLTLGSFVQYRMTEDLKMGIEYSHSLMFDRQASGTEANNENDTNLFFHAPHSDGGYRASLDRLGVMVRYAF